MKLPDVTFVNWNCYANYMNWNVSRIIIIFIGESAQHSNSKILKSIYITEHNGEWRNIRQINHTHTHTICPWSFAVRKARLIHHRSKSNIDYKIITSIQAFSTIDHTHSSTIHVHSQGNETRTTTTLRLLNISSMSVHMP